MGRYLVTGGCGFIGSHLIEHLIENGHDAVVVDNLSTGKRENLPPGIKLIETCSTTMTADDFAVPCPDGIFHLAAVASVIQSMERPFETSSINATATHRAIALAEAWQAPIVFTSSAAIYGDTATLPISEAASNPAPISYYGADKLASEHYLNAAASSTGIAAAALRLFNVYGPRQDPGSPYSGVVSIFIDRARTNQPLTIFGDGEQTRDFIYVRDVAACLYQAMQNALPEQFDVFNCCSGKATTVTELAQTIVRESRSKSTIDYREAREADIRHSLGDGGKAAQDLEFRPSVTVDQGLGKTIQWMSENH